MKKGMRLVAVLTLLTAVAQILLILGSWLVTAAKPELSVRSLLSSEGIRWFFGHFTSNLASPLLVWLLVVSVAVGCVTTSGLLPAKRPLDVRQRFALRIVGLELILFIIAMLLLSAVPHAVLLSIEGHVWPSSFSRSFIPACAFAATIFSITYALISGKMRKYSEVFAMLTIGVSKAAPLFVLYVLATQFYYSLLYIFG